MIILPHISRAKEHAPGPVLTLKFRSNERVLLYLLLFQVVTCNVHRNCR